jgi:hypothetical protein
MAGRARKRIVRESISNQEEGHLLSDLLGPEALNLLTGRGIDLIEQVGMDVVRDIILDIFIGKNLRDSTEILTRSRIVALNIALTSFFLKGANRSSDFIERLPSLAADMLARERLSKSDRWLANWLLGLTAKSVQNVLRDDRALIENYQHLYVQTCKDIIGKNKDVYGELSGTLKLGDEGEARIDWLFMVYLLNTIGSETLTIRGSEKSSYGKLFEKLVLGSLLSILGFRYEASKAIDEGAFWLSTQEDKRESDATLLYELGKGVRFDIGFIGRGNPEISLDKVTRYGREEEIQGTHWYMATIIIVDRLGRNSRVERMARDVGGEIVQMSAAFWPQVVARLLEEKLEGYQHELANMEQALIEEYLRDKLKTVPLESFIRNLPVADLIEQPELPLGMLEDEDEDDLFK